MNDPDIQLPTIGKVSAMITRGADLLVFRHASANAGIQVPAGTIEPGEDPAVAVIREAEEETGKSGFRLGNLLAHELLDGRRHGKQEFHDRWFYHLLAPEGLPDMWAHGEAFASEGDASWIPFDFFWMDVFGELPDFWTDGTDVIEHLREEVRRRNQKTRQQK